MLTNTLLQKNSSAGVQLVSLSSELLKSRTIILSESVTADIATEISGLIFYLSQQADDPITLIINTNGGEIDSGLLIYDSIKSCSVPVNTVCINKAYSMGALLFAAGKKRYIFPHAKVMIHQPLINECPGGNASAMATIAKNLEEYRLLLDELIAECTGKTKADISEISGKGIDVFFNAEEAVSFGLADRIIGMKDLNNIMKGRK